MARIGGFEFDFDTIYKYNVPMKKEVSEPDQCKIIDIMQTRYGVDVSEVDWLWESAEKDKNGYTGSFPKRLAKYVYNLKDESENLKRIKIQEKDLSVIGQIAKANLETERTLFFAITNHLDWSPGDYADDGSCMFSSYNSGRRAMEDQGGMAVLFFNFGRSTPLKRFSHLKISEELQQEGYKNPYGVGRCWFLPQYLNGKKENLVYVFFNYYGPVTTFTASRMIATLCGYPSKRMSQLLPRTKDSRYSIYINTDYNHNAGGKDSYIMCDYELMKSLESMGLTITG